MSYFCEGCGDIFLEDDDIAELSIREWAYRDSYLTYYHDKCLPQKWDRRVYRSVRIVKRTKAGKIKLRRSANSTQSNWVECPRKPTQSDAMLEILESAEGPLSVLEIFPQQEVFQNINRLRKFLNWMKHKGRINSEGKRGDMRYRSIEN